MLGLPEKFVGLGQHGADGVPLECRQFGALLPQGRDGGLVGGGDRRYVRFDQRGGIFVKIEKVAVIVVVCILVEHPVIWARPVAYLEIIASLYKSFTDGKPNPVTAANYYCFF